MGDHALTPTLTLLPDTLFVLVACLFVQESRSVSIIKLNAIIIVISGFVAPFHSYLPNNLLIQNHVITPRQMVTLIPVTLTQENLNKAS